LEDFKRRPNSSTSLLGPLGSAVVEAMALKLLAWIDKDVMVLGTALGMALGMILEMVLEAIFIICYSTTRLLLLPWAQAARAAR
jgi:hypothetical protein